MEKNQLESLHNDDFAVSDDEEFKEEEEDAKTNLGVGRRGSRVRASLVSLRRKSTRTLRTFPRRTFRSFSGKRVPSCW